MNILSLKGWMHCAAIASLVILPSCIDDNYDLNDIDTTVGLQVNDLVLPINIDPITLGTIIDIDPNDENSRIKVLDGQYVMTESGSFASDNIYVNQILIGKQYVNPIKEQINIGGNPSGMRAVVASLAIPSFLRDFSYSYDPVDEYIKSMEEVKTRFSLGMTITLTDPSGAIKSMKLHDFTLLLPPGLTGTPDNGTYNPATGTVALGSVTPVNNQVIFSMPVTAIDMTSSAASFDVANRRFSFASQIGIHSGSIDITELNPGASIPQYVEINITFDLSELEVLSFTGTFSYNIDGFTIDPIELNDLPEILTQEQTHIALDNPQIYLHLENPVARYRICARTGMTITPYRDATAGTPCSLDNGFFTIGDEALMQQPSYTPPTSFYYCLSPSAPTGEVAGFPSPEHVPYSSLGNLLWGNGLPSSLHVNFDNPQIHDQRAVDFRIGENFTVTGDYMLYAPLAFNENSTIVYTDTKDGWSDEDLDDLTINTLQVSTTVTSTLPLGVKLSGYPIDSDGNRIDNVEITTTDIPANAKNLPVIIRISGSIRNLDGITFTAECSPESSTALSPDQTLTLDNIRATVSGSYITEL